MSKKFYIISSIIVLVGISLGVFYLQVLRPGAQELPKDVTLNTAFGGEYDFNQANDKAKLVEFMYTNCPDVCPITSLEMSLLKNQLAKEEVFGDKIEFITITIDPKRDTIDEMQNYAKRFEISSDDQGWHFLRGNEADTKKVADSLGFLYRDPGSGEIVHSTYLYFIDKDDNLLEKFTMGEAFDRERAFKRIMRTVN